MIWVCNERNMYFKYISGYLTSIDHSSSLHKSLASDGHRVRSQSQFIRTGITEVSRPVSNSQAAIWTCKRCLEEALKEYTWSTCDTHAHAWHLDNSSYHFFMRDKKLPTQLTENHSCILTSLSLSRNLWIQSFLLDLKELLKLRKVNLSQDGFIVQVLNERRTSDSHW